MRKIPDGIQCINIEKCIGNNEKLKIDEFLKEFLKLGIFANEKQSLYYYQERLGRWKRISKEESIKTFKRHIPNSSPIYISVQKLKLLYDELTSVPDTPKLRYTTDNVNVENGIVDMDTFKLMNHDKSMYFDKVRHFKYIPEAKIDEAKIFQAYVKNSIGCEGIADNKFVLLMEIIGYLISNYFTAKKAFFLLGNSGLGKSILLHLLEAVFDEDYSIVPLHDLTDRFRLFLMDDKTINIVHEVGTSELKNLCVFKQLVSGESVVVEGKGQQPTMKSVKTKLVFSANQLPNFSSLELNDSLIKRLLVISYTGQVTKPDDDLIKKILAEKDIICSVALRYAKKLKERNFQFTRIKESCDILENHFENINSIKMFVEENCKIDNDAKEHYQDLVKNYNKFCKDNCFMPLTERGFKTYLINNYHLKMDRFRKKDKNLRGLVGIELK